MSYRRISCDSTPKTEVPDDGADTDLKALSSVKKCLDGQNMNSNKVCQATHSFNKTNKKLSFDEKLMSISFMLIALATLYLST
jgi:hypothetical protein